MAEEFQTAVCGGKWWSSPPATFGPMPCSSLINDMGTIGWPSGLLDMKARFNDNIGSVSNGPMIFQDIQKPHHPATVSGGDTTMAMDSSLQIMGIDLSSSTTTDWNQALLHGSGKAESNYHPMLQEEMNQSFSLDQQKDCDQGLATSFPMSSASYAYPLNLLQTLFDSDSQSQPSLFDNPSMNYPSTQKLNEFLPCSPKFSSFPKQQPSNYLHLSNNTPLWNASASALNDIRTSFCSSTKSQLLPPTFKEKPICPKLIAKHKKEEVRDLGLMVKKRSTEPEFKRPRIETPSPLPTFKVRKEKLGDRVTALQQLVSPFGKTDTASVLHEAIEYIKLLHDQVSVLSTPYMKNGASIPRQQTPDKLKDTKDPKQDLRSRGLCLVPISSTFPVATETTADLWAPTFGGTFR